MRGPALLRLAVSLVGVAGAAVAGCADFPLVPARTISVVVDGMAGVPPIQVTVEDGTGLITAGEGSAMATNADGFEAVFRAVPSLDRRDQLVILWAGGSCDTVVRFALRSRAADALDVALEASATQRGCGGGPSGDGVGVLRRLILTFSRRVDGARISMASPTPDVIVPSAEGVNGG